MSTTDEQRSAVPQDAQALSEGRLSEIIRDAGTEWERFGPGEQAASRQRFTARKVLAALASFEAPAYDGHTLAVWQQQAQHLIGSGGTLVRGAHNNVPGPSPCTLANWIQDAQRAMNALVRLAPTPRTAEGSEPAAPMLDDQGAAMIVNSHHYTADNIRALIADLKVTEAGLEVPAVEHRDQRARAGVLWRVMSALACDLPVREPVAPVDALTEAVDRALLALPEFRGQDDYLLAHGASLMSEDSHEIIHKDTLQKIVAAALTRQAAAGEKS